MNPTLASAESSAVIATLKESKQVNSFVYSEAGQLHVNHSLQMSNVPISSGSVGANKTMTFQLPKNGFLHNCWLKVKMPAFERAAGDDTTVTFETGGVGGLTTPPQVDGSGNPITVGADYLGARNLDGFKRLGLLDCIDSIKLESSGRVLESMSKWQILQRLSDLPAAERAAAQSAYKMGGDAPHNSEYTASLFLPFFWHKNPMKYGLDTDFIEAHRVVVTLSDCKCMFKSTLTQPDFTEHAPTEADLLCEYRQVDDATRQEIISRNFGGASGMLSKVVRLSREEAYTVDRPTGTGTRQVTVDLKESDCVTGIYITVECPDTGTHGSYVQAIKHGEPLEITNCELKFAGQSVINVPGSWLQYYGRSYGRANNHNGDGSEDRYTDRSKMKYVYRVSFDGLGTALSNVVALREISRAQLIIDYKPAAANQDHHVHIGYESVSFLTTSSATGRTNLSISS